MTIILDNSSRKYLSLNKEVKRFLSEVVDTLRPYTIDGEVTVINNGHLKIKGNYPSGTRSFPMATSPSDCKWKHVTKAMLKRFIYTEILQTKR